jgi:hypothetical protein
MNKKAIIVFFTLTMLLFSESAGWTMPGKEKTVLVNNGISAIATKSNSLIAVYDSLQLNLRGLSRDAFEKAMKGYQYLLTTGKILNENIISIIDFSLPSDKKRLFIIDLNKGELMYNTFVAHGKKSGQKVPTKFSNKNESHKSSLGFYITGETYLGQHGFSLRLLGEEKGINDNALNRGIVMHSAKYVDEETIESQGYIGRSFGCPAIPANVYKEVIETIQNGSCLFIYSPDKYYATHSKIIKLAKS